MAEIFRLCFVCLGNVVRSPLAENLFRQLAEDAGLGEKYVVDSAGTSSWHVGEPPDPRMRRVAAEQGFLYSGRARHFTLQDFQDFDLIIAMDTANRSDLLSQAPTPVAKRKVRLLREFDPLAGRDLSVPDPYYGGIEGFKKVYHLIERSCTRLLDALERGAVFLNRD